jgi:hypothetical protein
MSQGPPQPPEKPEQPKKHGPHEKLHTLYPLTFDDAVERAMKYRHTKQSKPPRRHKPKNKE